MLSDNEPPRDGPIKTCRELLNMRDFTGVRFIVEMNKLVGNDWHELDQAGAISDVLIASENRLPNGFMDYYGMIRATRLGPVVLDDFLRLMTLLDSMSNGFPCSHEASQCALQAWSLLSKPDMKAKYDLAISGAGQNHQTHVADNAVNNRCGAQDGGHGSGGGEFGGSDGFSGNGGFFGGGRGVAGGSGHQGIGGGEGGVDGGTNGGNGSGGGGFGGSDGFGGNGGFFGGGRDVAGCSSHQGIGGGEGGLYGSGGIGGNDGFLGDGIGVEGIGGGEGCVYGGTSGGNGSCDGGFGGSDGGGFGGFIGGNGIGGDGFFGQGNRYGGSSVEGCHYSDFQSDGGYGEGGGGGGDIGRYLNVEGTKDGGGFGGVDKGKQKMETFLRICPYCYIMHDNEVCKRCNKVSIGFESTTGMIPSFPAPEKGEDRYDHLAGMFQSGFPKNSSFIPKEQNLGRGTEDVVVVVISDDDDDNDDGEIMTMARTAKLCKVNGRRVKLIPLKKKH